MQNYQIGKIKQISYKLCDSLIMFQVYKSVHNVCYFSHSFICQLHIMNLEFRFFYDFFQ